MSFITPVTGKRYLVVGGLGYIGSHVTQMLIDLGAKVTVFDNMESNIVNPRIWGDEINFIHGDIRDTDTLEDYVTDTPFTCAFHFAAYKDAGYSMTTNGIGVYARNNVIGTIQLLNFLKANGTKNIVFSSSAAVYGTPEHLPITEHHPTKPTTMYGETKLVVEQLLKWYSKVGKMNYASLRYFNAAGGDPDLNIIGVEQSPANLIPKVLEAVISGNTIQVYGDKYRTPDGTGIRDYIHVRDLARAHILAATVLEERNQSITLNLGAEIGWSVLEVINMAKEITGKDIKVKITDPRPGDVATVIASADLAKMILGWDTSYHGLDAIIQSQWDIYRVVYGI